MDKLSKLQEKNKFKIYSVENAIFQKYGRIIDFPGKVKLANKCKMTEIPLEGCVYQASISSFEDDETMTQLKPFFGCMDLQIGYCNGVNTQLGAMEWHDCNEVNVGATDSVLFLASLADLSDANELDTSNVKAFFLKKDQAVVINAGTLHYAPCKVSNDGFSVIVALEKGTNLDLSEIDKKNISNSSDEVVKFLSNKNKYIICHKEFTSLIEDGVQPLVIGENFKISTI